MFRLKLEPATDQDIALIKKELGECASMFYKAWRVTNRCRDTVIRLYRISGGIAQHLNEHPDSLVWNGLIHPSKRLRIRSVA